jgi:hypothetical protein
VFIQIDAALLTAALFLAATDRVPTFDVEAHCRDIAPLSAPIGYPEICMRKEWAARDRLVPIDWPEPFGLVMIEAMACALEGAFVCGSRWPAPKTIAAAGQDAPCLLIIVDLP